MTGKLPFDPDGPAMTPAERRRLFGHGGGRGRRSDPLPAGHAALPGSGPKGETCKTCRHLCARQLSKTYYKCALNRARWTGGRKTDVRTRDPACSKWEARD